ncbi:MAG: UTP--glucose-1-phosphate uridylyltransferase GalU [Acidimicrobiia bacterium]|nr:UTP--glucose-1-phosphate uridylyltransferase GalU [Acidimicrobiia bacterium]
MVAAPPSPWPPVRKAVIPAAGLGTRFLPVTKAVPKEMLPLIDIPAMQYVVEEASLAGLDDVLVVTGRSKRAIEDHFDRAPELELELERDGKTELLAAVREPTGLATMHYVRQGEALGLGHAVGKARPHVGDEPFAVLLGDDVMVDDAALLRGMVAAARAREASVVALRAVPPEEISAYGCADAGGAAPGEDSLVPIRAIVEKPAAEDAPSNLAVMGRYVFSPRIFDALERTAPGKGGEIQLTDAIALLLAEEPVHGYVFTEGRYDIGKKVDYLRATVELGAARPDVGPEFRAFLADFARREGLGT